MPQVAAWGSQASGNAWKEWLLRAMAGPQRPATLWPGRHDPACHCPWGEARGDWMCEWHCRGTSRVWSAQPVGTRGQESGQRRARGAGGCWAVGACV